MKLLFKAPAIALAAVFSLGLMGCPESTDRPLILKSDASDVSIALEGTWIPDSVGKAGADSVTFVRGGRHLYSASSYATDDAQTVKVVKYAAWTGRYNDKPYVVLEEEKGEGGSVDRYSFYQLESTDPAAISTTCPGQLAGLMRIFETTTEEGSEPDTTVTTTPELLLDLMNEGGEKTDRVIWKKANR